MAGSGESFPFAVFILETLKNRRRLSKTHLGDSEVHKISLRNSVQESLISRRSGKFPQAFVTISNLTELLESLSSSIIFNLVT